VPVLSPRPLGSILFALPHSPDSTSVDLPGSLVFQLNYFMIKFYLNTELLYRQRRVDFQAGMASAMSTAEI
jgi:hypothetical protein